VAVGTETTPICEVTGLALPIMPNFPSFAVHLPRRNANIHHHNHPENSPHLRSLAGLAVRYSRVQRVNHYLHMNYHNIFAGPPLTGSEDEAFRISVLSAAGVIPRQALDLSKRGDYRILTAPEKQYDVLRQPNVIKVDRPRLLAPFIADYAARQGIEEKVDNGIIDEFLNENTEPDRKRNLASLILAEALDLSLDKIDQDFSNLKKAGYMKERKPDTFRLVAKRLVRKYSLPHFQTVLTDQLAAA
jgi:hypothetical protein